MSKQLEPAGAKISENMLTSISFKSLPSDYDYLKTVHKFSQGKVSFVEITEELKISKDLVTYKLPQKAMQMLLCYPKELLRKVPRSNLKKSV